jgi:hypothetical protein
MQIRILDLDGAVAGQPGVRFQAQRVLPLRRWGPRLRIACGWGAFRRFERHLAQLAGESHDGPTLTFVGSGDFHHVSLALVKRQPRPLNLLILDNHPDWMRRVPLLHCGTWAHHAARLPQVWRIFHVGGDVDFDNGYGWLAPWALLRCGKITVWPARRRFRGRGWARVPHAPLRDQPDTPATRAAIEERLAPFRADLADLPLYVSFDRDVLTAGEAAVNWDSGHLSKEEVLDVIEAFGSASAGLAGVDVVGDRSAVRVRGTLRRLLHATEHPPLNEPPVEPWRLNQGLNLELIDRVRLLQARGARKDEEPAPICLPFRAKPAGPRANRRTG